ncbi:hypothetical protein [Nocardia veterana]|uniref:Uncharacterized protein n=1 Tax=Nocardia veterana TaxID=132249 RepID=A0A7X6LY68_9NOCA|nr:hypothetical protein [Nocardia veterana]NKY86219.1 hypothetical protein [Nocardia veterana]
MKAFEARPDSDGGTRQPTERPDLTAWRRRHELRRSAAAQPVANKRVYRRTVKHRDRQW